MDVPAVTRGRFWAVLTLTLIRIPLALSFAAVLLCFPMSGTTVMVCAVLLALVEITDMLDGLLARRLQTVTEWGAMLDPYADGISRMTVYWALAAAHLTFAAVPWAIACRDLTVAYCRIVWARGGRSASARWSGKAKAVIQAAGAFCLLLGPLLIGPTHWLLPVASWTVLAATLASLAEYGLQTVRAVRTPRAE